MNWSNSEYGSIRLGLQEQMYTFNFDTKNTHSNGVLTINQRFMSKQII